jgi:DNA invertase Pin-like site-specific DNA recombinase
VLGLYARVSTMEQGPEPQLDELKAYANRRGEDAQEFVDHGVSGTKDSRPALDQLMDCARRREISALVIVKLDRLARSVRHLTALAEELDSLGVDLVVLDQAIDTGTATGKLLVHVLGAIGEFERTLIVERTKAGVAAARRRGRHPGRPRALSNSQVARARRLRESGNSVRQVASIMGAAPATIHRAIRWPSKKRE